MKKFLLILLAVNLSFSVVAQDPLLEGAKKKLAANDFSSAKIDLTKILDSSPKNKIALNLRGQTRTGLQDFYGAIGDYTAALELDSTYADAYNNRGEAKMALGDDDGALGDFTKAIKFNAKLVD